MKNVIKSLAFSLALAVPSMSAAQELSFSAGATLTSEYVANGMKQSNGPAFQPWVEVEYSGFYAGLWASNTAAAITGSDYEIDVYAGYRNDVGPFSYDIGYAHYFYTSPSVNCCGEFILSMGYVASDTVGLGLRFAVDPKTKVLNSRLTADFAVTEEVTLSAAVGKISKGGQTYGSIGASYAVNDNVAISAAWHDTNMSKGLAVVSFDVSF